MNIDPLYIKYFPSCEDVFETDVELAKKHLLPICSINLKAIYPEEDQWLHFISAKEIGEGCVGEQTQEYHTTYCKEDMLGFDVVGSKYVFEADWNYFIVETIDEATVRNQAERIVKEYRSKLKEFDSVTAVQQWLLPFKDKISTTIFGKLLNKYAYFINPDSDQGLVESLLDRLEKEANEYDNDSVLGMYQKNTEAYEVGKTYFEKHGKIYPMTIGNYARRTSTLEELEKGVEENAAYIEYPEFWGILDDIKFTSTESKSVMEEYSIPIEEMERFEGTNLMAVPQDQDGVVFEYIGSFTGYLFQCYGADCVYLFYNKALKKAVICFEYT